MVHFVYPNLLQNINMLNYFQKWKILVLTLNFVWYINEFIISLFLENEIEYLSTDLVYQFDEYNEVGSEWFTNEFLNKIKLNSQMLDQWLNHD